MLTHFHVTQQGESHIKRGSPCQDYSASRKVLLKDDREVILAAIADGVGNCTFSQYGAETAVNTLLQALERGLPKNGWTDEALLALLKQGFQTALTEVEAEAERRELPFMEFDSTLTGVVYDGLDLWFGHIGDDGLVLLYTDGSYEMVTVRHSGQEFHSVYPLRNVELWQFGKAPKGTAALVMMTDGVLDYCVDGKAMNNRVYFPFLAPALTHVMESDEQAEHQRQEWEEFFQGSPAYPDRFREKVTDDITFLVAENPKLVAQLPAIEFDFERWKADTIKRKEQLEQDLYKDYQKYKSRQTQEKPPTQSRPAPSVQLIPPRQEPALPQRKPAPPRPAQLASADSEESWRGSINELLQQRTMQTSSLGGTVLGIVKARYQVGQLVGKSLEGAPRQDGTPEQDEQDSKGKVDKPRSGGDGSTAPKGAQGSRGSRRG